ncbi:MAG TPA: hypothetical protein VNG33_11585 [Polyangiaceae bacterium]|nr:hypothetical protein [Polyangiaceae bacterium]
MPRVVDDGSLEVVDDGSLEVVDDGSLEVVDDGSLGALESILLGIDRDGNFRSVLLTSGRGARVASNSSSSRFVLPRASLSSSR